jgi:hypothetical protein
MLSHEGHFVTTEKHMCETIDTEKGLNPRTNEQAARGWAERLHGSMAGIRDIWVNYQTKTQGTRTFH